MQYFDGNFENNTAIIAVLETQILCEKTKVQNQNHYLFATETHIVVNFFLCRELSNNEKIRSRRTLSKPYIRYR